MRTQSDNSLACPQPHMAAVSVRAGIIDVVSVFTVRAPQG